jgi:hypothetical protein
MLTHALTYPGSGILRAGSASSSHPTKAWFNLVTSEWNWKGRSDNYCCFNELHLITLHVSDLCRRKEKSIGLACKVTVLVVRVSAVPSSCALQNRYNIQGDPCG